MNNMYGIFSRKNQPFSLLQMKQIQFSVGRPNSGYNVWCEDGIALGVDQLNTFEVNIDSCNGNNSSQTKHIIISAGRVDNISELAQCFKISRSESLRISDHGWIQLAYSTWGEDCVRKVLGDWAFAVWHPLERRLFIARDHIGNTALYYYVDQNVFAFASSRQILLDLNLAPITMDELYLAQVLVSWNAYHSERTIHTQIRRLPPAHTLTITKNYFDTHQYWHPEEIQPLNLPHRQDYITLFKEIFDDSIKARLRVDSSICGNNSIAIALSGGLDSTSVAVTAAEILRQDGKKLQAFTSIPLSNTEQFVGCHFGDEFPLANITANYSGNIDLHAVDAAEISPIQGIRRTLKILHEPAHAAVNFFWILQLEKAVIDCGCRILLSGYMGNAGVSWTGDVFSQSLALQIKTLGLSRWIKQKIKRTLPHSYVAMYSQWRQHCRKSHLSSAINLDFARRLQLAERQERDTSELTFSTPLQRRLRGIRPGRSIVGAINAELFGAYNIDFRDPTADIRVLEFALSVPDHIFIDPKTGIDRWLIREAMKNRLPDEVRLNRRRGRQAGDLVPRLRKSAIEVEATLDELARGPAASYVNIPYMRQVWKMAQSDDTIDAFIKSQSVLLRGIMAGLFVNDFYK